jgi:hypothetical protein
MNTNIEDAIRYGSFGGIFIFLYTEFMRERDRENMKREMKDMEEKRVRERIEDKQISRNTSNFLLS